MHLGRHPMAVVELVRDDERFLQALRDGMIPVRELHGKAVARSVSGLGRSLAPPAANHLEIFRPGRLLDSRELVVVTEHFQACEGVADRKSTRLNSSHHSISYAVFCLKKK